MAVIAMSNLPSIGPVSWNTELGVGVTFTSIPFFANRPFSCATHTGQLKPPGKTIRLTVFAGAGGCAAHPARNRKARIFRKKARMLSLSSMRYASCDQPGEQAACDKRRQDAR